MEAKQVVACMQPWQLDRIRAKVEKMMGEISIRIYAPDGVVYRIWYNSNHNVALYGREEWSETEQRDRLKKAYRGKILQIICSGKARINVLYKDGAKAEEWFGPDPDMKPLKDAYDYVINIEKHVKDAVDALFPSQED
jgi:hypothetical protein